MKTKPPKVSIITVVYNGVHYIEETINSILNQSYSNIEYIIIDGGSKDGTIEIIKKYEHKLYYWISEPDNGIYDAMNKAISVCTGEWLNFMNAGDTFSTKKSVENFIFPLNKLKNKNFIYSNYFIDNVEKKQKYSNLTFLRKNLCHQTIFYHKSIILNNNFEIKYIYAADYAHLIQNHHRINPLYKNDYLVNYDSSGISSDNNNKYKIWFERYTALKNSNFPFFQKYIFILYAWLLYNLRK